MPIEFHAGARLEPGGPFGAGATYAGGVTLKVVPVKNWIVAYATKLLKS